MVALPSVASPRGGVRRRSSVLARTQETYTMTTTQRTRVLGLFAILAATGAYACGSDADKVAPPADGGALPDASTPTGDGGTPSEDAAAPSTKGGFVSLLQARPAAVYTTTAHAGFYAAPPALTRAGCTATVTGACTVQECGAPPSAGDAGASSAAAPTAGEVTITGGLIAASGIVLTPNADGTYGAQNGAAQAFQGGETLTVKAAGSATGAPAFEGKTVVAPTDVVVTPALSFVTPTAVSRTTDFTFNWTAGGAGHVNVVLSTVQTDQSSVVITCKALASAGSVVVPQAAVAKLFATSATLNGTISATPTSESEFAAGDYKVNLSATGNTLSGAMTTN